MNIGSKPKAVGQVFLFDVLLRFVRLVIEPAPRQVRAESASAAYPVNSNSNSIINVASKPWLRISRVTRFYRDESIHSVWLNKPDVELDVSVTAATSLAFDRLLLEVGGGK